VTGQVDILNLTLGVGEDAELFWKDDMQPLLESKFEGCITGATPAFNLRVPGLSHYTHTRHTTHTAHGTRPARHTRHTRCARASLKTCVRVAWQ
jgi:hypothetical protein